ncbi:hypothetical protein V2J09_018716 [Rumex salicifolius]
MATSVGFTALASLNTPSKPGVLISRNSAPRSVTFLGEGFLNSGTLRLQSMEVKATADKPPATKSGSILCGDCEGNGVVQCKQCEGKGVNSKDHFNGQFKAGALCWLCRGRREILCGNCNGAGFCGGFMSTGEG